MVSLVRFCLLVVGTNVRQSLKACDFLRKGNFIGFLRLKISILQPSN